MVARFDNNNYQFTNEDGETDRDGFNFKGFASSLMGGEEPVLADISQSQNQLSSLRGNLANQNNLQQAPVQPIAISSVMNPQLEQLVKHFGVGPETADGELGQLLKDRGY